jgi:hypothetical protein
VPGVAELDVLVDSFTAPQRAAGAAAARHVGKGVESSAGAVHAHRRRGRQPISGGTVPRAMRSDGLGR